MNKKILLLGAGGVSVVTAAFLMSSSEDEIKTFVPENIAPVEQKLSVGSVPGLGAVFVTGPCYEGGLGNDVFPREGDALSDCYDLTSDGRDLLRAKDAEGSIFVRASNGRDTIYLGSGNDVVEVRGEFNLILDAGPGDNLLYLPGLDVPDVVMKVDGEDILMSGKRGSIRLRKQYPREGEASPITGMVFDTQTLTASQIYTQAIGRQATDGDDVLDGTPGDDVIYAGLGNDVISALSGNDTIFYEGGDDTIKGSHEGMGQDELSLPVSISEVTFIGVNDRDLRIDTALGTVTLEFQIFFPVGHERSNIERFVFKDGVFSDAEIRQRLATDK